MKIHGLQKLTLLDYPGKVACTVFLGGCNFRCPFCHNFQIVDGTEPPIMDGEELIKFLSKRQGLLEGVCVTGGEPLLRADIAELLREIKALGFSVKLDTNGSKPALLKQLVKDGLVDYVAMDIKSSLSNYAEITGVTTDISAINESVQFLLSDAVDYEFRTTVIDKYHNDVIMSDIARWIKGAKRYYIQPFVDRDTVPERELCAPSKEALKRYAAIVSGSVKQVEIRAE